ncbi:toll/interleukin-1 receptor domain-containing protein [Bradyrhizobium xenonodulans]|uniref:Toll/interleukin-1 receptor domain-containing protein n=1 Tax=Bradyrhizobium xenonodulans TaxID=2736875 RepID=A0ABY7MKP7_9BRAD|nr:toll/interleukin-1 receptor domain-containing protein [Bradyrhizobium xenonodulans]WBL78138.1 toll/interleukin-1 receptor domain-containing protein [Bradyrhizobium xenonodulans]
MAISQDTIRRHSHVSAPLGPRTITEARLRRAPTAFLSHSHKDAELARGLQNYLQSQGWEVYVDWEDTAMPETPNRTTAEKIQKKIRDLDLFLFVATQNSAASRWCPWEIGYADGVKPIDRILIVLTSDSRGTTYGNEYLQLYNHVDQVAGVGVYSYDRAGGRKILRGRAIP